MHPNSVMDGVMFWALHEPPQPLWCAHVGVIKALASSTEERGPCSSLGSSAAPMKEPFQHRVRPSSWLKQRATPKEAIPSESANADQCQLKQAHQRCAGVPARDVREFSTRQHTFPDEEGERCQNDQCCCEKLLLIWHGLLQAQRPG